MYNIIQSLLSSIVVYLLNLVDGIFCLKKCIILATLAKIFCKMVFIVLHTFMQFIAPNSNSYIHWVASVRY